MTRLRARAGVYIGLFTVTLATLMYEIVLTRIFSVTMWYHFAFGAISLALFGMTFGALLVHLNPGRFSDESVMQRMWIFSLLFALSIVGCFGVQLLIPVDPSVTFTGILSVVATCIVVSIPFVFSGVVVCLALTRFPARVNRLYAADLVGAALGCVLFVFLVGRIDAPSVVIATGGIAALGALSFAVDLGRSGVKILTVICTVVIAAMAIGNAVLHESGEDPIRIRYLKGRDDQRHTYEKWNAFSRVTVDGDTNDPNTKQLGMVIDSTAGTSIYRYDGDTTKVASLSKDITNLAHYARKNADVLVIGVGGGRDILSALVFKQHSVKGVEINGDILQITNGVFGDFSGHLDRDPRVSFVNDEARAYLARTSGSYDIIQISLIDTWAATSSGAFALSENSLYTTRAWEIFLDRLKPGGILSVSRWFSRGNDAPPYEIYRTLSLAVHALKERGVRDPRRHIAIYEGTPGLYGVTQGTLLVSPDPLPAATFAKLATIAKPLHFRPVLTPTSARDRVFADLAGRDGPGKGIRGVNADISPPTDDRPFFFQMVNRSSLGRLTSASAGQDQLFQPVLVLAVLAITVLVLALLCIVLPLLRTTRRNEHRGMSPFYLYFAAIGTAFLMIEVSQLQRLSVYLGHPTFGLTVVLFSVLLFSGIGSMATERFANVERPGRYVALLGVLLGVIVVFGLASPGLLRSTESATTPLRIVIAVGLLAPLSFMMGMPFALGMRMAATRPGATTSFMWGINGATSVCGSVFGLVTALFFGIAAAFWVGALIYLVALLAMRRIIAPREPAFVTAAGEPSLDTAAPVGSR